MLLLSAGSRLTRAPVPASLPSFSSRARGPPRPRRRFSAPLGNGNRDPRARAVERASLGAAAAFARGRAERGAVATRAADELPDAKADERAESHFSREDLFDVPAREKRKTREMEDDDEEDDDEEEDDDKDDDDKDDDEDATPLMSDVEATRALESALGVHIDASAARIIARDFAALGVDTPGKLRRAIVGKSARPLLTQALAVVVNAAAAVSFLLLFKNADAMFGNAESAFVKPLVEFFAFALGGAFALESFAQLVIFDAFLVSFFVFEFADLRAFATAVLILSRDEKRRASLASFPGLDAARDAASAVDAARRLASLRRLVDDAVAKTPETKDMDGVQRLGALLELSVAKHERGFRPARDFALSPSEAMRVASVLAAFDEDADGYVTESELAALLRAAADSASVEVIDAMEWDPYAFEESGESSEARDPGALAFAALDADEDGRVSLEEFVAWWRGGCPLEEGRAAEAAEDRDERDEQDARVTATQSAFSAGD